MRSDDFRDHFVVGLQTAAEYSVAGIGHHAHATAFIGRLGCICRGEWICCRFHTFNSEEDAVGDMQHFVQLMAGRTPLHVAI